MFSEQNVPKGGDFATVACFYVAGAPKKNVFFVLRVFFVHQQLLVIVYLDPGGQFVSVPFHCLSHWTSDVFGEATLDVGTPWPDCTSCAPKGSL